jgi:Mce-associated membrane protein
VTADETSVEETTEVEKAADVEPTKDIDDPAVVPGRLKRFTAQVRKRSSGRILPAALALLVAGSLALLGAALYFWYLPDRHTEGAAAKAAISAASDGAVAVLSYSPDTLDRDFSSAKSHLTGDFLNYYNQFTQQIVAPAAKEKSVKTSAVVLRAALSEFHPDSAVVLLFVNQTTQTKDRPEPTLTSSSVVVQLTKADGKWLISSFNPV